MSIVVCARVAGRSWFCGGLPGTCVLWMLRCVFCVCMAALDGLWCCCLGLCSMLRGLPDFCVVMFVCGFVVGCLHALSYCLLILSCFVLIVLLLRYYGR